MIRDSSFEGIWNSIENLDFPEVNPEYCVYAEKFAEWADKLLVVIEEPDAVLINQAKILLLDKYFEWRSYVPKIHRNRLGSSGHVCIFNVFEYSYMKLKTVELTLTPPMLFLPAPSKPQPQIAGIFLGELEE